MTYTYYTTGTCSRQMNIQLENGVVRDVEIIGGCNGNLKGIRSLVLGMKAEDVIERLRGIRCGDKATSCPDQLAIALEQALAQQQ